MVFFLSIVCIYLAMSAMCFFLYAKDKQAAIAQCSRVSENTLWFVGLLCGWPGALVAQRVFRHKTAKLPFLLVFWLTVAINISALVVLVWLYQ
jgi:uncharacterized membrane protein YsdA (DUF1294 family)